MKRFLTGLMVAAVMSVGSVAMACGGAGKPGPDEWDRLYNVDFFIKVNAKFIGLQIKPVNGVSHIPEIYKEKNLQKRTHEKFEKEYGGKVFYVFSLKDGDTKRIANPEVVEEIKKELDRLLK